MLAGSGEAFVDGAADAVVTVGVVATVAAVTLAALLIRSALGAEHAHAVLSANVFRAGVTIGAVFRAAAAALLAAGADRTGRPSAGSAFSSASGISPRVVAGGRELRIADELGAPAARRRLQGDEQRAGESETEASRNTRTARPREHRRPA